MIIQDTEKLKVDATWYCDRLVLTQFVLRDDEWHSKIFKLEHDVVRTLQHFLENNTLGSN